MGEVDYLSYGFAAVVLGGGVMGFIKAGQYKIHACKLHFAAASPCRVCVAVVG